MKEVLNSEYCSMKFDDVNSLILHTWLPASENMTDAEFRDICSQWRDFCISNNVSYNLLDTRQFLFTVTPETQNWLAVEVAGEAVKGGMKKMATILPEGDVFAQVSVEQAMDENEEQGGLPSMYFDDVEKAKNWLLS